MADRDRLDLFANDYDAEFFTIGMKGKGNFKGGGGFLAGTAP